MRQEPFCCRAAAVARRTTVLRVVTALLFLILLAAGCGETEPTPVPATPTETAAAFPYTVAGTDGAQVTFDQPPERIVAFDSAALEALFAIGEGDRVVGTHDFVTFPPEAADVPRLGGAFGVNIEKTLALEPDLVFIFFDTFLQDLQNAGLKVLYLKTLGDDFGQVADRIRMWGRITGSPDEAESVAASFEAAMKEIEDAIEAIDTGPSIFHDTSDLWTPGPDTLVGRVFEMLKLQNIAHDIEGYAQLSPEIIVERDPEMIITTNPDAIAGDPAFGDVRAVTGGRVYEISLDLFGVAGPRFADDIETLARLAYPDLFE